MGSSCGKDADISLGFKTQFSISNFLYDLRYFYKRIYKPIATTDESLVCFSVTSKYSWKILEIVTLSELYVEVRCVITPLLRFI